MAPRQQGLIWNYFKYLSPTDSTLAVCNACGDTISRESEDTTKLSNFSMTREGLSQPTRNLDVWGNRAKKATIFFPLKSNMIHES